MTRFKKILKTMDKNSDEYKRLLKYLYSKGIITDGTFRKWTVNRAMKKFCNK